ncbi:unnamed protein product [Urochloa humidicola]
MLCIAVPRTSRSGCDSRPFRVCAIRYEAIAPPPPTPSMAASAPPVWHAVARARPCRTSHAALLASLPVPPNVELQERVVRPPGLLWTALMELRPDGERNS